jgi:hypothetical protein
MGSMIMALALGGAMAGLDPDAALQNLSRRPHKKVRNNDMTSDERRKARNKNKAAKKSRGKNKGR